MDNLPLLLTAYEVKAIRYDAENVLIGRDLIQQLGQYGCIADTATGDLHGPNLQRFFVNSYVYLAPNPALGSAMLAGVPLAFGLDPGAINQKVERAGTTSIRQAYVSG